MRHYSRPPDEHPAVVSLIQTPTGLHPVAPLSLRLFASLTDLLAAIALLDAVFWFYSPSFRTSAAPYTLTALVPFVYALLAVQGRCPSVGRWATGIERWTYKNLPEYEGKGVQFVRGNHNSRGLLIRVLGVWCAALLLATSVR